MKMKKEKIYCTECGTPNDLTNKFCVKCGAQLKSEEKPVVEHSDSKSTMEELTTHLNSWTGGEGAVKVSLRDFFSQVFKKHTEAEAEEIFIVGTPKTTPTLENIENEKVHPWLFSRILVFILALSVLLYLLIGLNPRIGILATLEICVAIAVPVAGLILFFESNVFQNISIYQVQKMVLLGGILSLILASYIDRLIANAGSMGLMGSIETGVVEELGKVLVAAYFISKLKATKIFNGLLIGASVGAGFSIFENIMYLFNDSTGQLSTLNNALLRSLSSIADHTEWCAITTAALIIAMAGKKISVSDFVNVKFLRFFIFVVLIHTCWDWKFLESFSGLVHIVLIIATWLVIFVMIHAGLREVRVLQRKLTENNSN